MSAKLRAARAHITFLLIIIVILFPFRLSVLSRKTSGQSLLLGLYVGLTLGRRDGESYVVPSDVELIVREAAGTG